MKFCETPVLTDLAQQLTSVVGETFVNVGFELYTTKSSSSDRRLIKTLDQQLNDATFGVENPLLGSYTEFPLSPPRDRLKKKPSIPNIPSFSAIVDTPDAVSVVPTINPGNMGVLPVSAASTILPPKANGGISKRRALSTPASTSPLVVSSPFGPLAEVGNMKQYMYLIAVLNASDPDRDFSALQPAHFHRIYTDLLNPLEQTITSLGINPPQSLWNTIDQEMTVSDCKAYWLELPQQFLEDDDSGISWSKMFFYFNKRRKRVLFVNLNSRPASYRRENSPDSEGGGVLGEME